MNRRNFLKQLGMSSIALSSTSVLAAPSSLILPETEHRTLTVRNMHTGDLVKATYWEQGEYLVDGLAELYYAMRDHRANKVIAMDLELLDNLHHIQQTLESRKEVYLFSAYRTPHTNESLRKQHDGVAKQSLHMQGKALDFRIPGISNKHLNKAALACNHGGVGYYPNSGFIHLDTGRKRHWIS